MRILITSGGTKVPIDPVRNISNQSSGGFGTQIAIAALKSGNDVIYLTSQEGKSPFSETFDFYRESMAEKKFNRLEELQKFSEKFRPYYQEHRYHNFDEYAALLEILIKKEQPEVVILAAAVSDYLVSHYVDKKIRSTENLTIQLTSAPKIIHFIKQWIPNVFLVGFKLLINSSDKELVAAAMNNITQHHCDLVVANNLASLQQGTHEILLIEPNGSYTKHTHHLAPAIMAHVLQRGKK